MHSLTELHKTLQAVSMLLDSAASQIREAQLLPVKSNIHKIGEALSSVFEIKSAIYKQAPELHLEPAYEEPPEEVRLANRRLGEALLTANAFADEGKIEEAHRFLTNFAANETSEFHSSIALNQAKQYMQRDDA